MLDEVVLNKRLVQLQRSIASYRGYLTRLYRKTEELMQNVDEHEIQKKQEAMGKAFADFKEASKIIADFLLKLKRRKPWHEYLRTKNCVIKDSWHSILAVCKTCHH